jgi:hypothetical protein
MGKVDPENQKPAHVPEIAGRIVSAFFSSSSTRFAKGSRILKIHHETIRNASSSNPLGYRLFALGAPGCRSGSCQPVELVPVTHGHLSKRGHRERHLWCDGAARGCKLPNGGSLRAAAEG